MENGYAYDGGDRLAQQLSSLTVSGNNREDNNNNDGLLSQVMNAVEAAEATIKQQVEENNRLRSELHKKIQELEKYKSDDKEGGSHHHQVWDGRVHLLQSKDRDALPLVNKADGIPSMNNSTAHGSSTIPLLKDPMRNVMDHAILNHGGHNESSKSNGTLKLFPGSQPGANKAGLYQLSSIPTTSFSPTRYQLEGEYDPHFNSPGRGLVPITELNDTSISLKRDVVNAWEHDQEISQLRKHLTDYSIKEAQIQNEKYVLEKRIAYMRMAFDQQQQDLVDAASKALSYRQDIIEENIRLTYALQDAQEERSTFVSYLMPLLAEYSLQPPVADAQSIASNVKVLFRHLQEKLIVTEAKLKESQYQLIAWRSDLNSNFSQSPFHSTGKNGLELVPQRAYSDGQTPLSSDPLITRDWDTLGHQIGLDGEIARNPDPENLGRYSPLSSRNTTSVGISAQPDLDRGNLNHHIHRSEENINKQVAFSDPVSTNDMDDLDMEGRQNEGEALVNWAPKSSPYTTLDDPGSSYSPYLTPVLEEPSSSFSEAADEDPLPGVESLQISGEAFPGRELQASGYSVHGTTSCNFEWVRHMEDGSVNYIDGAKQPNYLVTADDVDTYLAIEVQPMDNRKRKGELVKVFANENRKIMCDPKMHSHIERALYTGHASYKLSLSTGYLELWEPATLTIKRDGYSIKGSGPSGAVITDKFSPSTIVTVPFGIPIEFSIIGSGGVERKLRAEDNITDIRCARDTVVLILRLFIKRAGERKKGKKRGLFFSK